MRVTWIAASLTVALVGASGCGGTKGTGNTGAGMGGASSASTGASTGTDTGSATGSGGSGGNGPAVPTVSAWLGTNVSGDLPRVDVTYQLTSFDTPSAQKDANGYPMAGASGTSHTDLGFVLPTGTYKISYKGTGSLGVSGIGKIQGAFQAQGGEQRAEVAITGSPGNFGQFLDLAVTNAPGQTVTDIHLLYPGFDYDAPQVFLPGLLALLKPFRALRFMGWMATNNSKLADWKDRPTAASFGASPAGEPYEHIVELINETGKDGWINVPEHATDEFVHALAQLLASSLDFKRIDAARKAQGFATPWQLDLELSNETWNGGFSAYQTFLDAAKANPARYTGVYTGAYGPSWMSGNPDLMKVGQYEGDRLVQVATIFRQELKAIGQDDRVAPVLSGWALGAVYSDVALRFIKDNYGAPKDYVRYVASAPYFGPDDAQTGALDALFASADQNIDSMDATFQDFHKLVTEYGIEMAGYEGGQGISGNANLPIKHLAQHDQRMYDAYTKYFTLWKKDLGESLFMHFDLAGTPGTPEFIFQYGFWGSIISLLEDPDACSMALPTLMGSEPVPSVIHHCPKYKALREQVPH